MSQRRDGMRSGPPELQSPRLSPAPDSCSSLFSPTWAQWKKSHHHFPLTAASHMKWLLLCLSLSVDLTHSMAHPLSVLFLFQTQNSVRVALHHICIASAHVWQWRTNICMLRDDRANMQSITRRKLPESWLPTAFIEARIALQHFWDRDPAAGNWILVKWKPQCV